MKLVVFVMYKTEQLESFLHELKEKGISGATILNSTGLIFVYLVVPRSII